MKIILIALLLSSVSYGKLFDVKIFKNKLVGKNVNKLVNEAGESSYTKKLVTQKISLNTPAIDVVSSVAQNISKKSAFGDALISKTDYPVDVLRQYTKYGDRYVDTVGEFSKKSMNLNKVEAHDFKNKFPSMPTINFKTSKEFNDKMVETLKFTGKRGWEVSQGLFALAKKHPKSTAVTALMAWYVADPQSFFEEKEKLMAFVSSTLEEGVSDATQLVLRASSGVANGFMSVVKEKMTVGNMMVLLLLFLSFMVWKLRSYIKRYFKIKLEGFLQKEKKKSENNEGLL